MPDAWSTLMWLPSSALCKGRSRASPRAPDTRTSCSRPAGRSSRLRSRESRDSVINRVRPRRSAPTLSGTVRAAEPDRILTATRSDGWSSYLDKQPVGYRGRRQPSQIRNEPVGTGEFLGSEGRGDGYYSHTRCVGGRDACGG